MARFVGSGRLILQGIALYDCQMDVPLTVEVNDARVENNRCSLPITIASSVRRAQIRGNHITAFGDAGIILEGSNDHTIISGNYIRGSGPGPE